jgi:hypothetical protein
VAGVVAAVVVLALLIGGAYALSGGDDPDGNATVGTTAPPASSTTATTGGTASTTATTVSTTGTTVGTTAVPTTGPCANPSGGLFVCITDISVDGPDIVVDYEALNYTPKIVDEGTDRHIHFFFPVGPNAEDVRNAGAGGPVLGSWLIWDTPSPFRNGQRQDLGGYTVQNARDAGATSLCALVADAVHAVYPGTGNCVDLPPEAVQRR